MHQRSALSSGKYRAVYLLGPLFSAQYNHAARAAQGFVRCSGDEMSVGNGRRVYSGGNQTGYMGHVHKTARPPLHQRFHGISQNQGNAGRHWPRPQSFWAGMLWLYPAPDHNQWSRFAGIRHILQNEKYLPDRFTGLPWVRCPPWLRFIPITVSPGFKAAK